MNKPVCFYHHNCLDGIVSALNIKKQVGGSYDYQPIQYGNDMGDYQSLLTGSHILFVDYCPTVEQFNWILENKPELEIWILDHHKTSWDIIPEFFGCLKIKFYLHQKLSGAGLTSFISLEDFKTARGRSTTTLYAYSNINPTLDLRSSTDELTYLTQFRDLWTDSESDTHETAACLHDAVEMLGVKKMDVYDAETFFEINKINDLIELGRVFRNQKNAQAETLIKLGKVLTCKDVNGEEFEILFTVGEGNMGTTLGEVWCGKTHNSEHKPRVSVLISISLKDGTWVLSVRSSKTASGLGVVKALCGDEGGGHVHACGGRIKHANEVPLDIFLENVDRYLSNAAVVL